MDRSATYDFLLVIPSNHETTISIENRNFSDHIYLRPPATRFSVKFGNGSGSKKLEWCPYQIVKKCDNIVQSRIYNTGIG